jgi:hypothetical protein
VSEAEVVVCDEHESGFGWIAREPAWMGRTSHALAVDGRVWLFDPVDFAGLEQRLAAFGEPAGVVTLFDHHQRDSVTLSARLAVPLHACPSELPGTPFRLTRIPGRWRELALWWPERATLLVAEAVGTADYYCAPGRPLGVHPLLRLLRPPRELLAYRPEHILCGHGAGLHEDASAALVEAVARSRRDLPALLPRLLTATREYRAGRSS